MTGRSRPRSCEAIASTLARAMREDERVIVLGEDVAEGGPYLATAGLVRGVRPRARAQHADQRGHGVRRDDRRRPGRPAAGGRDHVHRLHHARARSARQPGGQGALHVRRTAVGAARAPHPGRVGPAQRRPALAEPRGLAHARPGAQGRDAELRGRRRRPAVERDRRSEPGGVRREQVAVLPPRDRPGSAGAGPDRAGAHAPRRRPRSGHDRRAVAHGRRRARGGRPARRATGSRPR